MKCRKCGKPVPGDGIFCPYCGVRQEPKPSAKKQRGNGQGYVYNRNGKWIAQVTMGYGTDGKRKTHSKTFEKKSDAIRALPTLKYDKIAAVDATATLNECFVRMMDKHSKRISQSAIDGYGYAFRHFQDIAHIPVAQLKTAQLQACVDRCTAGKRTKENMKAVASLIFKYALQNDIVPQNYAQFIEIPKEKPNEREPFTPEEVRKIFASANAVPYADYIAVLICTGMRPNEMFMLTKEDYFGTYFIGGSKTTAGKNRIIPLPGSIQPIVKDIVKRSCGEYIFCAPTGKKMDLSHFRKRCYYPALKKIGVRPLPPYSCRHTFATLLKNINVPITDKQRLMGHSSFSMTAHYTHTDIESLSRAVNLLETELEIEQKN